MYTTAESPVGTNTPHRLGAYSITAPMRFLSASALGHWRPMSLSIRGYGRACILQYALDSNALAGRHLRTSILGRYNGVAYYALVATAVGSQAVGGSTQVLATEHPDMQAWLARGLVLLDRAVFWVGLGC